MTDPAPVELNSASGDQPIIVRITRRPTGYGWMLWRGSNCLGTSEAPSPTVDAAIGSARRYALRAGHGPVALITAPAPSGETA